MTFTNKRYKCLPLDCVGCINTLIEQSPFKRACSCFRVSSKFSLMLLTRSHLLVKDVLL